jgi:hypothetical protein
VARWWYWWTDSHQDSFDQLWAPEGDRVADDLADLFGSGWPWLIGGALATGAPTVYERLVEFSEIVNSHSSERLHASHPESIATWGSFQLVRKRRSWREPSSMLCPVCEKDFWSGTVTSWALKKFGPPRYCMECCLQSRNGDLSRHWTADKVIQAIRELRDSFGAIPQQQFAFTPIPYDGPPDTRDRRMRALVSMPPVDTVKSVLKKKDWLGILQAAELVGETWRPSRGTWCRADDGHRCRSLLEKSIDDWFTRNGISHESEPRWPQHPELNPSGAKRADWLLIDGTYVECAGMMEDSTYATKIQ